MSNTNDPTPTLMEQIVDHLTQHDRVKSTDLAVLFGRTELEIRAELIALEQLGIVYRTGRTRGTRWWLG